ncbi:hypothetical protein PL11201_450146 [Planktothrix sp. PCC 11201]|nr:hypothetical protein PL11201_450146 [Planktothrix sp. PCC 11201]
MQIIDFLFFINCLLVDQKADREWRVLLNKQSYIFVLGSANL